jgi:hypothetical protein
MPSTEGLDKSTATTNAMGFTRNSCIGYAHSFLTSVGMGNPGLTVAMLGKESSNKPQTFERQLAILEMATDENISVDDTSDYFAFVPA